MVSFKYGHNTMYIYFVLRHRLSARSSPIGLDIKELSSLALCTVMQYIYCVITLIILDSPDLEWHFPEGSCQTLLLEVGLNIEKEGP